MLVLHDLEFKLVDQVFRLLRSCGLLHSSRGLGGKACENACLIYDSLFLRTLHCGSCPRRCDLVRTGKHERT